MEKMYYILKELTETTTSLDTTLVNNENNTSTSINENNTSTSINENNTSTSINENILLLNPSPVINIEEKDYWSPSVLPLSYYLSKIKSDNERLYKYKASKAESLDIFKIKPKALSSLLTQIDIFLLQNIKPVDLLTSNIPYLTNKNTGLTNFISTLLKKEENFPYFLKVLKYLIIEKNYNSVECIKKAFLRHKVSKKILIKLEVINSGNSYSLSKSLEDEIPPFEIFIKDLEDSSNNTESTSLRFCKLVELLVKIQNNKVKINKKREHFLLYNIWRHIDEEKEDKEEVKDDYLYLYIP